YAATADKNGAWKLTVATPEAGGPYTVTFDDGTKKTLNNILIGELWLCSGQSNMEMPMKGFKNQPVENANMDILHSKNPQIRLFTVK
ncbi:UNVERIFIED_CONTAM: sialate O-acetylesterase, partial [Prevotella sp. 15_C9]